MVFTFPKPAIWLAVHNAALLDTHMPHCASDISHPACVCLLELVNALLGELPRRLYMSVHASGCGLICSPLSCNLAKQSVRFHKLLMSSCRSGAARDPFSVHQIM